MKKIYYSTLIIILILCTSYTSIAILSPLNENNEHIDSYIVTSSPEHNYKLQTDPHDDVYVSPTGSDMNGDGTDQNPLKTINKGVIQVNSGGKLHLIHGIYNENSIVLDKDIDIVGEDEGNTIINAQKQGPVFIVKKTEQFS